jgi:hypothetical protein
MARATALIWSRPNGRRARTEAYTMPRPDIRAGLQAKTSSDAPRRALAQFHARGCCGAARRPAALRASASRTIEAKPLSVLFILHPAQPASRTKGSPKIPGRGQLWRDPFGMAGRPGISAPPFAASGGRLRRSLTPSSLVCRALLSLSRQGERHDHDLHQPDDR